MVFINEGKQLCRTGILVCLRDGPAAGDSIRQLISSMGMYSAFLPDEIFQSALDELVHEGFACMEDSDAKRYSITPEGSRFLVKSIAFLKKNFNISQKILCIYKENTLRDIRQELGEKRAEWRKIRTEKLDRKQNLLDKGMDRKSIKKEFTYKKLQKEQDRLSTVIKHIEKRLNRKIAQIAKNE